MKIVDQHNCYHTTSVTYLDGEQYYDFYQTVNGPLRFLTHTIAEWRKCNRCKHQVLILAPDEELGGEAVNLTFDYILSNPEAAIMRCLL